MSPVTVPAHKKNKDNNQNVSEDMDSGYSDPSSTPVLAQQAALPPVLAQQAALPPARLELLREDINELGAEQFEAEPGVNGGEEGGVYEQDGAMAPLKEVEGGPEGVNGAQGWCR